MKKIAGKLFEVSCKYLDIETEKSKSHKFVVKAVNFTDAEKKAYDELDGCAGIEIVNINPSSCHMAVSDETKGGEFLYKVKSQLIDEKETFFVQADDIDKAKALAKEYGPEDVILSIQDTKFEDVYE